MTFNDPTFCYSQEIIYMYMSELELFHKWFPWAYNETARRSGIGGSSYSKDENTKTQILEDKTNILISLKLDDIHDDINVDR